MAIPAYIPSTSKEFDLTAISVQLFVTENIRSQALYRTNTARILIHTTDYLHHQGKHSARAQRTIRRSSLVDIPGTLRRADVVSNALRCRGQPCLLSAAEMDSSMIESRLDEVLCVCGSMSQIVSYRESGP